MSKVNETIKMVEDSKDQRRVSACKITCNSDLEELRRTRILIEAISSNARQRAYEMMRKLGRITDFDNHVKANVNVIKLENKYNKINDLNQRLYSNIGEMITELDNLNRQIEESVNTINDLV